MTAGRTIQSTGPRVGDPCLRWMLFSLGSTEDHKQNKQTEYSGLMLCDAVYDCVQVPTFWRTMLPTHSVYIYYFEYYEEGDSKLLRNFGYNNLHITLSKKSRVFANTNVRAPNLAKYNPFLVSALPTVEDQDPRWLLLLYQWRSERNTRPRRALCPYGVVYGQSHKVSRNTYSFFNFITTNG